MDCRDCKSAVDGGGSAVICRDGLMQGNYPNHKVPACMREELPDHWVNEDGSPKFYRQRPGAGEDENGH